VPINDEDEMCSLDVKADWTEATGTYWCHGDCLEEAVHPEIPLYVLALRRDAAVYGARGVLPEQ
jgi:hypothetical protein